MTKIAITGVRRKAYVYEIRVDGVTRYIGKGTGRRVDEHVKIAERLAKNMVVNEKTSRSVLYTNLAEALLSGAVIDTHVVIGGLTDVEAFRYEIDRIATQDFGQLWNQTQGGDGQTTEYLKKIWSDQARLAKHSVRAKKSWEKNPERRQARFPNEEAKKKQREMLLAKWADPEYRAMQCAAHRKPRPNRVGKPLKGNSEHAKIRWADPEFKSRAVAAMKIATASSKHREEISRRMKAVWATPEFREKWLAGRYARRLGDE